MLYLSELNAQDHVLLPVERANSARMDEPIPTPITKEGRKYAFLVRITSGIPFLPKEMVSQGYICLKMEPAQDSFGSYEHQVEISLVLVMCTSLKD